MANPMLVDLGFDLSPFKDAGRVITATMADLNRLTSGVEQNARNAALAQKPALEDVRVSAQAAVKAALDALAGHQKITLEANQQSAALRAQVDTLKLQTVELLKHAEIQDRITEKLREQIREKKKAEKEGGFGAELANAVLGGGASGKLGGQLVAGAGIGAIIEYSTESIIKFVEKLKEGTIEASKLSQAMDLFNKTANGHGLDPAHFMTQLQLATEGLVTKLDLAVLGARALNSGLKDLSPEKVLELTHATVALAEVNKSSAKQAVEAITQMFTRGSERSGGSLLATVTGIPAMTLRVAEFGTELNRAGRQAESLDRILALVIAQEAKLGETPETLEKALARIKIVFNDLFASFGQGVNESGGMQSFFGLLKDGAAALTKLEDKARIFGHVFGDALATVGTVAAGLYDTFKSLLSLSGGVAQLGGSLMNVAAGTAKTGEAADGAKDSFTAWRTLLLDIVKTFLTLNAEVQILALHIKRVLQDVAIAALLAKPAGSAISNPLGTLLGLKFGKRSTSGTQTSDDPEIAAIQANLQKLLATVDSIGTTPGIPTKGKYGVPPPTDENRAKETRLAGAQAAYEEARQARIKAGAEADNKIKLAAIEDAKETETAAYKAAEVSLEDHLQRMRSLELEAYGIQQDDTKNTLIAQVGELEAKRKDILAKAKADKISATSPEVKAELAAVQEKQLEAEENYQRSLSTLKITHDKANASYDAQYAADILAARKTGIADALQAASEGATAELAIYEKRNRALQALNQKLLGNGELTPEAYQAQQLQLINALRDAQVASAEAVSNAKISAANKTYEADPNKLQATATRNKSLSAAAAEAAKAIGLATADQEDQTTALNQEIPGLSVTHVTQQFGGQQQALASQLQQNQEHPELAIQSSETILRNLIASYQAEQQAYSTIKATGDVEEHRLALMQQALANLVKYNVELRQTLDMSLILGGGISAVGQGVGANFHSKFAQNLSQNITAGAKSLTDSTGLGLILGTGTQKSGVGAGGQKYSTSTDVMKSFSDKMVAAITAVDNFTQSIMNSKSAISGGVGGAVGGAGLGNTLDSMFKSLGPWGAVGGAVLGGTIGAITGDKQAKVTANINQLNTTFKNVMNEFSNNTNNLENTIQQLQQLMAQAEEMQAGSKKGSAAYQQAIDQYISQITQLTTQQQQTIRSMNQQLAILQEPAGAQGYLQDLQSILQQYEQFAGAAKTTTDLANANQFLTQSLQQYETSLATTLLQDNTQAIQDALTLNDLLYQRQQLTLQYSQQVQSILGEGVVTRQQTRAQSTGQQIQQLNLTYQRQKEQLDEQVSAATFRVQSEQQIFNLAQTRIGLENQLLSAQNVQTQLDMQRITALQGIVQQISGSNFGIGALGALLAAIQAATVSGGSSSILDTLNSIFAAGGGSSSTGVGTDILELLASMSYQNRAQMGFAAYQGQNLGA